MNKRKKIAIISRESDSKTIDIKMLEAELLKRGSDVTVLSKLLTKDKSLKAIGYVGHVIKQEAAILSSAVVVLDTYCIPVSLFPHRKGTRVVQMWHALGAIKQFGWQTVGKESGTSEKTARLMKMHRGYDYIVSASELTAEHFCEAFRADRSTIVKYGLPRIDYIKAVSVGDQHETMAAKILAKYSELKSRKKTVLYAPTFRRGKSVDVKSLVYALDPEKYDLVVKLHPLYRGEDVSQSVHANVIFDEEFSSYDWLSVADIIISDYSSFVIESTLANKPLFLYVYDADEYAENTGLNIDFDSEPIAPYVFRDVSALASSIDRSCVSAGEDAYDMDALRRFRDRYIDIDTDNCTAALAEFLLSLT